MAREINLVPDIKDEMIKTLKLRNFIFFLCIVVAAASVGITTIFGLIMAGQQVAINHKKDTINNLSAKINSYSDLNDFLTMKDQLGNISTLTDNKQVLSRTFNILSALFKFIFKDKHRFFLSLSEVSLHNGVNRYEINMGIQSF